MSNFIDGVTTKKLDIRKTIKALDSTHYHERLSNCCSAIDQYNDGKFALIYPCNVHICPLCIHLKTRKEYAIACQVYDKLIQLKPIPILYFATLTVEACQSDQVPDAVKNIKTSFNLLIKSNRFNDVLLGSSLFIHIGFNNDLFTPHAHIVLALRPSFASKRYVNEGDLQALWQKALKVNYLPHVHLKRIGKAGSNNLESNKKHFARACSYGANFIKFEHLINNPIAFNQIIEPIKGLRKSSHTGLLKELRLEVATDYQATKTEVNKDIVSCLRFNNSTYSLQTKPEPELFTHHELASSVVYLDSVEWNEDITQELI